MKSIKQFLTGLKNYNIMWLDPDGDPDEVHEEFESVEDLFYEITIELFCFNKLEEIKTQKYIDSLSSYYVETINNEKRFLTELIPLISSRDGEWRIVGDQYYYDELGM